MNSINNIKTISELVNSAIIESDVIKQSIIGREDEPYMIGYADFGIPWDEGSCETVEGLKKIEDYHKKVTDSHCAAWMDNTTLVTAVKLLSDEGPEIITPLTVWDLATFIRSVVCYEKIYHHKHKGVDDARLNKLLGDEIFIEIPLPIEPENEDGIHNGPHRYMCDLWRDAFIWLTKPANTNSLQSKQLAFVTKAWQAALGDDTLNPLMLANYSEIDKRWDSPSNKLIYGIVNITDVHETSFLDSQNKKRAQLMGIPFEEQKYNILSDLNLRSYLNQRFAEFFSLPYAASLSRLPFRNHLYDQRIKIQQELTTVKVIENRYTELSKSCRLRLPVFLSIALKGAQKPEDLWQAIKALRSESGKFRKHRVEMDIALERGDLKEAEKLGKALNTTVEGLLKTAGEAIADAGAVVIEDIAKGDLPGVKNGISAAVAGGKKLLKSSWTQRLMWRLHKPQLLWINNIIDESKELTDSLPDFTRIWQIPQNQKAVFSDRFRKMDSLMQ